MENFTAAKIAQFIATPDLPPDSAQLRFKNFVAKSYILTRVRDESDGRGTLVFGIGDVVTAAVLSQMVDLGGLSKVAMPPAAFMAGGPAKFRPPALNGWPPLKRLPTLVKTCPKPRRKSGPFPKAPPNSSGTPLRRTLPFRPASFFASSGSGNRPVLWMWPRRSFMGMKGKSGPG